jgi:hypothetical protein
MARVNGNWLNSRIAIGRAVDELLALPHVTGKRIESLKLTVLVVE